MRVCVSRGKRIFSLKPHSGAMMGIVRVGGAALALGMCFLCLYGVASSFRFSQEIVGMRCASSRAVASEFLLPLPGMANLLVGF